MDRLERILKFHRLLYANHFGLTVLQLRQEGRCSRATVYRDMDFLRDVLGGPVENDNKATRTYRYAPAERAGFQLPGLWLMADEIFAIALVKHFLGLNGTGLLGEPLQRLMPKVHRLLGEQAQHLDRIRIIRTRMRPVSEAVFRMVAESVLQRRQLAFTYDGRHKGDRSKRLTSPQWLTYYQDNWYLDAWDEGVGAMRSFAVERISAPRMLVDKAREPALEELATKRRSGYGLSSGPVVGIAIIRFSSHAARWVLDEQWHDNEIKRSLPDGSLELRVPYSDPRELLMDIRRYGSDAQILGPPTLQAAMVEDLERSLKFYREAMEASKH
jgi:predicted DNA-binding transcriptional regulator YafY